MKAIMGIHFHNKSPPRGVPVDRGFRSLLPLFMVYPYLIELLLKMREL